MSIKEKQLADYALSLDLLSSLPESKTESKVIEKVFELFTVLFAPTKLVYLSVINRRIENIIPHDTLPLDVEKMKQWMIHFQEDYAYTDSENEFLLRIDHQKETLGIIKIQGITFPEYLEHYLYLALVIIKICGLAINNARAYERIKQSEERLKKINRELKKSQVQLVQSEKMCALGTMVAGVAHELNNPMTGIVNFIQTCCKHTDKEDKPFEVLQDAEKQTKRCIEIVDNVLNFSHMETDNEKEFRRESCTKIFEQVLKLLKFRIESEKVRVIKDYAQNLPHLWMRVNGFQQAFLNIITNALDALKESEIKEVHIQIQRKGNFLHISIADTGSGITKENLQNIFDPFFTTKPPGQGTGIGLSICHNIVKTHQGMISLKVIQGREQHLIFYCPLKSKKE